MRQKFALFVAHAREALTSGGEPIALDAATRYAMGAGMAVWEAATAERDELSELIARAPERCVRISPSPTSRC